MSSSSPWRPKRKFHDEEKGSSKRFQSPSRFTPMMRNIVPRQRPIQTEVKSVDHEAVTPITTATTTPADVLYDSSIGADFYNRIGRKVNLKSIYIRGVFKNGGPVSPAEAIRIVVYTDNQFTTGTVPTTADVLADVSNTGAIATNPYSNINLNNRDRFQILKEFFVQMPAVAAGGVLSNSGLGGSVTLTQKLRFFRRLGGFEVSHGGSATGTVTKGNVLLTAIGEGGAYTFTYSCRIRFTDV